MMKLIIDSLTLIHDLKIRLNYLSKGLLTFNFISLITNNNSNDEIPKLKEAPNDHYYLDQDLRHTLKDDHFIYLNDPSNLDLINRVWDSFPHYPLSIKQDLLYKRFLPESLDLQTQTQALSFGSLLHKLFTISFIFRYLIFKYDINL